MFHLHEINNNAWLVVPQFKKKKKKNEDHFEGSMFSILAVMEVVQSNQRSLAIVPKPSPLLHSKTHTYKYIFNKLISLLVHILKQGYEHKYNISLFTFFTVTQVNEQILLPRIYEIHWLGDQLFFVYALISKFYCLIGDTSATLSTISQLRETTKFEHSYQYLLVN